eukprot:GHVO01039204.1.p1 GENE.GHVO01039204.1~~GHVO01039204.1.p1  ORF type:complete len:224 (+),score=45.05 GHVO01039204.1:269-940(+)
MYYHEVITHVPMMAHPNPKRALVIGGGDGGAIRELCRWTSLEVIDICEIDKMVIDVSKKYLPGHACGYDDPRVNLHVRDGKEFLKEKKDHYDVVVIDSSDPIGPNERLFDQLFYDILRESMTSNGIAIAQAESHFMNVDEIKHMISISHKFKRWDFCTYMMPTYPGGSNGMFCMSNGPDIRLADREGADCEGVLSQAKVYSREYHRAIFDMVPKKFRKELGQV